MYVRLNRSPQESPVIPDRGCFPGALGARLQASEPTAGCLHCSRSLFSNNVETTSSLEHRGARTHTELYTITVGACTSSWW